MNTNITLWGTGINKIAVFRGGEKMLEARSVALVFYQEEDRLELSPLDLKPGDYTIVYSQLHLSEDGRRKWRSMVFPDSLVIAKTPSGAGVVLNSDNRTRAEVVTDEEPDPEEVLRLSRLG